MGACGYLSKSAPQGTLIGAIRKIASGDATFIEDDASHQPGATGVLTFREVEILRYLADGKRREDIVDILGISLDTVRTHIKHIISKMGATNTPSAIARGYESGILK